MFNGTRRTLLAAGAALAATGLAPAGAQTVKTAKLGHSFADSHPRATAMRRSAEDLASRAAK